MPNIPFVVDGKPSENIDVWAMDRGHSGRDLWVDVKSLRWLISYAADELSRLNVVRPYIAPKHDSIPKQPTKNCGVPGLWRHFDFTFKRFNLAFVRKVPGLPDHELLRRRYLPIDAITDDLWVQFGPSSCSLESATLVTKRDCAIACINAWCQSILDNTEDAFVNRWGLPTWTSGDLTAPSDATAREAALSVTAGEIDIDDEEENNGDEEDVDEEDGEEEDLEEPGTDLEACGPAEAEADDDDSFGDSLGA